MEAGSRLRPPHPSHHADLPERDAPPEGATAPPVDLNAIDAAYLELSRESARPRGMLFAVGLVGCLGAVVVGSQLFVGAAKVFVEVPVLAGLLCVALAGLFVLSAALIRLELRTPRDEPVRFNRKTRKVYVNGVVDRRHPFSAVRLDITIFDWETLQAEVLRFLTTNGRFPVMRYTLDLVVCRPGTFDVVDRFWLVRQVMHVESLDFGARWAFIRAFMQDTNIDSLTAGLKLRHTVPTLRDSLSHHLPFLDLSRAGIQRSTTGAGSLLTVLQVAATPILLVAALSHYVVMRLAPAAVWPREIDVASRRS